MRNIVALLALPLVASAVYAQDADGYPSVKISGFGTAALTWTNTDKAEFSRPNQSSGVQKSPRHGVDSNLGLQADVQVNNWLSFTAQGLVRRDGERQFGAELPWVFAKLRLSDEVSVRLGRVGLPVFMISDYRNVGYVNNLLRPPGEMYSQVAFDSANGADVTWQHTFGETTVTSQLAVGQIETPVLATSHVMGKRIMALHIVAERGPFTLRAGHARTDLTIDDSVSLNTLMRNLRAAGTGYRFPQLNALANQIHPKDSRATFNSLGLSMDWKDIVIQSEVGQRKTGTYINDTTAWYAMGGYRMGKFLPYVSHSSLEIDSAVTNTVPKACPAGYPAACTPTMRQLSAIVDRLPYSGVGQGEQTTTSIGVRWDFYRSLALKAQIDRVKPKVAHGLFLNPQPGFTGPVTVGAVALDFVF